MSTNIFPIRDSLDDSGCRRVNESFSRDLVHAMSDEALDEHIGELDQELRDKRAALKNTETAMTRALNERMSRRG